MSEIIDELRRNRENTRCLPLTDFTLNHYRYYVYR